MTNRDYLNSRIIPIFALMLVCFVAFGAAGFAAASMPWIPLVPFVGFAGCIIYLQYGVRCPSCRRPIAMLAFMPNGGYFRLSKQVKFCPFCGLDLEAERHGG